MGLFYRTPTDLKDLENCMMALAQEIAIRGKGYGTPGFLEEELQPTVIRSWTEARERLAAEGRSDDLKRLRKSVLKTGTFMDNGPYNHVFRPLILEICPV